VLYQNAGLSTVRGGRKVMRLFSGMKRPAFGFDVKFHQSIAAEDGTVVNERTDVLIFGPVRIVFWVWGKFEVREGRITLWRDYIDSFDFLKGTLRGLVGAVIPSLQRKF
jgi:limonene-1,2-epoxide hydrolase